MSLPTTSNIEHSRKSQLRQHSFILHDPHPTCTLSIITHDDCLDSCTTKMRRLRTIPAVRIQTIITAITFIFGLIALIAQWRLLHTSSTVDGTTPVSLSLAGNGADPLLNDFDQDHDHGSEKALVPIEKQKPIIAILCATRSVETWKIVNDTPLQNLLIRSVGETLLNEELESWRCVQRAVLFPQSNWLGFVPLRVLHRGHLLIK